MELKPKRDVEATIDPFDRRTMGVFALPGVAAVIEGGKDAAIGFQRNPEALGDRAGRLGITGDARKLRSRSAGVL